jgi:hypothetical protein
MKHPPGVKASHEDPTAAGLGFNGELSVCPNQSITNRRSF